ncbi:MAG: heme-copper oxidase subunit III [Anaerolineales bacterium]|nr:heme-copper oxidase subunit III [Anaerolineales bacterium]
MNSMTSAHPMSKASTGKLALFITLGTESVFFVTLLVAYIALRDSVTWNVPHTWTRLTIPLLNTVVLLVSVLLAWLSGAAIRRDNKSALKSNLLTTILLGLFFVAGQIYEFSHAGLHINDSSFGGVFFTLMGFHALHVLAGVVFLGLNYVRASLGDFSAQQHEAVELGVLFWYYVAAVWLVLFVALYLV